MRLRPLVWMALLASAGCAMAAPEPAPLRAAAERFVNDVSTGLATFDVTEHYAPGEDRRVFVAKAFQLTGADWQIDGWKELRVVGPGGKPDFHLGLVRVRFDADPAASRAAANVPVSAAAFLADTKILTRFVVLRHENEILFVYSETYLQPPVQRFLDGLSGTGSAFWKP